MRVVAETDEGVYIYRDIDIHVGEEKTACNSQREERRSNRGGEGRGRRGGGAGVRRRGRGGGAGRVAYGCELQRVHPSPILCSSGGAASGGVCVMTRITRWRLPLEQKAQHLRPSVARGIVQRRVERVRIAAEGMSVVVEGEGDGVVIAALGRLEELSLKPSSKRSATTSRRRGRGGRGVGAKHRHCNSKLKLRE